jgi:hypothetical protein
MAKRIVDVVTAAGILTFVALTMQIGLRLLAFHR